VWWWELRPHPEFGTLEVRVPDAQSTLADAAGVVGFVHTLVAWLASREEPAPRRRRWRIEENRWSAARHGVEGRMADLETGESRPTRDRLRALLGQLEPVAEGLGSAALLRETARLIEANGAIRQRRLADEGGVRGLTAWLADHFLDPPGSGPPAGG
jgi:carboxylate-amine ligase